MKNDQIICMLLAGEVVTDAQKNSALDELMARLNNGDCGDDVPIAMQAFGCDYDSACGAVFGGCHSDAILLLNNSLSKSETRKRGDSPIIKVIETSPRFVCK